MYQSTVKEFFCVALLLCMIYYGQADYFSVQPPSVVKGEADQPVTQLECGARCFSLNSADSCTIRWFRWTDTGIPELLADNCSCHRIPYSKWTHRNRKNVFTVVVRSKLIINKFNPAYSGRYFCSLKTSRKDITSSNITLEAANASLPIVISQQNCCLPSIQNIKAHLLPKENKSMCVNVSWNEVPGDCHIMQWKLDMLEWDGIPSYDFADDGNKTNNFIVVNRSWRKICGLTKTKYYQFQLSTTVKPHNTSLKFGSYTYFFGNKSSPARIVHGENHYEVLEGDDLVITCQATGMPTPDVRLLQVVPPSYIRDTKHVQVSESTFVVTKRKVIKSAKLSDAGLYLCIASNTLVNPPQGIRNSTAIARITVSVIKGTETSGP